MKANFSIRQNQLSKLSRKFLPPPQDLCQDDGVNWKEVAIRYKQEAEQWKEENHKNLIDVNRLLIEKDNHLNEIKRLGAELYKANCNEMKNRANETDQI